MSESSQGIGNRRDPLLERAREIEERDTQELAERFAQALAPHVIAQRPVLPIGSDTPSGWRAGDGPLTQQAAVDVAPSNVVAGDGSGEADANQRVVLSVETRDLGKVSLILDRSEGGVRVVIGVADTSTVERMLPERDALARQLQGSGLTVQSVQFVRQSEVGTVLAPAVSVGRTRMFASQRQAATEDEKVPRRGSRKLNVIG
ncbi:MAG: flagellar hook-length control protein FliK [Myxococcota bacterium]